MPSSPSQQGQPDQQNNKKLLVAVTGILIAILLANLNKIKGFVRPSAAATVTSEYPSPEPREVNTAARCDSMKLTPELPPLQPRAMSSSATGTYPKGQVYFLSHGGPPTMFETNSAPYKAWQKYGQTVAEQNPRGLVVVSAHWESNNDQILGKCVRLSATKPAQHLGR